MLSTQSPKSLFITAIIDGLPYSKCSLNKVISVLFLPYSKQFPEAVHHIRLVLHERVGVAVQGHGRVFVTQYLRKRFYVHAALQSAGGEGVAQGMEAFVGYLQFFEQQLERPLI